MTPEQKKYDDDDGRIICSMDLEGIHRHSRHYHLEKMAETQNMTQFPHREPLSKAEARQYTLSAAFAGLAVVAVFAVSWVLFILFCTQIWFR